MSETIKITNVLAAMQDDYKAKLSNALKSHDMKTLEGVTVYWRQENMAQRSRYYSGLLTRDIEAFVDVILHRALNAQGGRLFKPEQREQILKGTDPDVIMEMANAILADAEGSEKEFEEAAKN